MDKHNDKLEEVLTGDAPASQPNEEVKEAEVAEAKKAGHPLKSRANVRIAAIVGGVVAIALLGYVAGWAGSHFYNVRHGGVRTAGITIHEGGLGGMRGGFMHDDAANPTDGKAYTRLTGVVTQVNGTTFTIAGNGTTKTITTNDSTVFNTASKKVSVNDSVVVLGTDNNGTFTATDVRVTN